MSFYSQISKYYDHIFPISKAILKFLTEHFKQSKVQSILDVACGSGNYLQALAKKGYEMTGIELNPAMVETAKIKAKAENLYYSVIQSDMRDINSVLDKKFDALICIGNSLVHLTKREEIFYTLKKFYSVLNAEGILIIQIINYDRILEQNVEALPTIQNQKINLTFERKYDYKPDKGIIYFNTVLTVPEGRYENSIPLYPLLKKDLICMIEKAGFKKWDIYGSFDKDPWSPSSYATVIVAHKASN